MVWDIDKIEKEYSSLDELKETPRIIHDKNGLADMINYHYGEEKLEIKPVNIKLYTPEFFKVDAKKLKDAVREMAFSIANYQNVKMKTHLIQICPRVSVDDFDAFVESYLNNNNPELLTIYKRYKEENRIELRKNRYKGTSVMGRCYYFDNIEGNYLSAIYKGTLNHSSTLVHEIAHASTIEKHENKIERENYSFSVFREALSKYHEILYSDYLIKAGKYKEGISSLSNILDSFALTFDFLYSDLLNLDISGQVCKKGEMNILSEILAFRLYYTHYKYPREEQIEIETLEQMIGVNTDYEIFKAFDLENAKKYVDYTFNKYHELKENKPARKIIRM